MVVAAVRAPAGGSGADLRMYRSRAQHGPCYGPLAIPGRLCASRDDGRVGVLLQEYFSPFEAVAERH